MNPEEVVKKMMGKDAFSRWLGINIESIKPGFARISMVVRDEMLNGFSIAHGGITYSLADSALAFASNSRGMQAVSIETQISHLKPSVSGDVLTAVAEEVSLSSRFARYLITISSTDNEKIAVFYGTVFKTGKEWTE